MFGVLASALGLLNLATGLWTKFDVESMIIVLFLLFFGANSIIHSFSQKLSREDKLEELDERNQLIELKTKSKSFRVTQGICFGLMLIFFVMAKVYSEKAFIGIGAGLGVANTIFIFTEFFTYLYYEAHC